MSRYTPSNRDSRALAGNKNPMPATGPGMTTDPGRSTRGDGAAAPAGPVDEYVAALLASPTLSTQVTHHAVLPEEPARFGEPVRPLPAALAGVLGRMGIERLYSHQAVGLDALRAGKNLTVAVPTAGGKSLVYNLPVVERFLRDPEATALYLFPLKALAQDQLAAFTAMTAHWTEEARPTAAVYDGDTTAHFRRKIREKPPAVLFTNPEMLHLALLPHHPLWSVFFAGLSQVVVDEVHTYRGLLGTHMAQVFRRLLRIAGLYGARPSFVFTSATVGNPGELARALTGLETVTVTESGAPRGRRHYVFMLPDESPSSTACKLLRAALARNLRTIVYCQSRRMTELISLWASEKAGEYKKRISAYRAGYLPEERREIEARMHSGDLLAVISTSALELGIDIGDLDLCILVGYPGTVMSTLQRGGRVGRSGRSSAVVLLAGEDALDHYIVRHGAEFFSRPAERAVVNPTNPVIVARHLECAAAELPFNAKRPTDAVWLAENAATARALEATGLLLRAADGESLHASRKRPQRHVSLRGSGSTVGIETPDGELIGTLDAMRAMREAHPGALYLHRGVHYEIAALDLPSGRAQARPAKPPWYTRPRTAKDTEILETLRSGSVGSCPVQFGRLRVTEQVVGYERRSPGSNRLIGVQPLDFPPQIFETEGLWFCVPSFAQESVEAACLHFMGAIHALEHAAIAVLPLMVMADRNDLGGISKPMHAQTGYPMIFVYDGLPGGAGLARAAFEEIEGLLRRTRDLVAGCPCDLGCPACVHSPKCGSGNRPIDKAGALALADLLLRPAGAPVPRPPSICISSPPPAGGFSAPAPQTVEVTVPALPKDFVVVDVETRHSAGDVGGWHRAERMGVSIAVAYDSRTDDFSVFTQPEIPRLAALLADAPLVVGFNIVRFDYAVLTPHAPGVNLKSLPTLDMLQKVHAQLSYRVSLDNLATATLDAAKSADGLLALQWWKEQRLDLIEAYCRQDVALTRDLFLFGRNNGYLLFTNKAGQKVRVCADWGE